MEKLNWDPMGWKVGGEAIIDVSLLKTERDLTYLDDGSESVYGLFKNNCIVGVLQEARWEIIDITDTNHNTCLRLVHAIHRNHSQIKLKTKQNMQIKKTNRKSKQKTLSEKNRRQNSTKSFQTNTRLVQK